MKSGKNIEPLSIYRFKALDWRVENGFTTPEWDQYKRWWQIRLLLAVAFAYGIGAVAGIIFMALG